MFKTKLKRKYIFLSKENMALRKHIFEDQKWKGSEKWTGENGVDGRYDNRSAHGGQCVISENGARRATWGVDLGDVVIISHIDIYYRTGNSMKHGIVSKLNIKPFLLFLSISDLQFPTCFVLLSLQRFHTII